MTPKEKAKELIEKFDKEFDDVYTSWKYSEKCALLCVDWHLREFVDTYGDDLIDNIAYWEEVKKEIEKL